MELQQLRVLAFYGHRFFERLQPALPVWAVRIPGNGADQPRTEIIPATSSAIDRKDGES